MQRSISTLLTTLLLFTALFPTVAYKQGAEAAPTRLNSYAANQTFASQLSPYDLTFLAYQGYFKNQGIPSSSTFLAELESGTITAQNVMQAAVNANRLSEQTLNDQSYRFALEGVLQEFVID